MDFSGLKSFKDCLFKFLNIKLLKDFCLKFECSFFLVVFIILKLLSQEGIEIVRANITEREFSKSGNLVFSKSDKN